MSKQSPSQTDIRTPFGELERHQRERLMLILIYTVFAITALLAIPYGAITIFQHAWQGIFVNIVQVGMLAVNILAFRLLRRGEFERAGYILFPYLLFIVGLNGLMVDAYPAIAPAYLSIIVTAGFILGPIGNFASAMVAFIMWLAATVVFEAGILQPAPLPEFMSPVSLVGIIALSFIFVAILNHGATTRLQRTLTDVNYKLIEANRQLEDANSLKSKFVARMSHELRTPLNAIGLSADMALRKVYGPVTDKQKEALSRIISSGKRLEALIDDILDISRIEAGQLELAERPVPVRFMASTVKSALEANAHEKGLEFSITVAPNMPSHVLSDEGRLIQILTNLTENAIKFTERGEVRVSIEPIERARWHMLVRDTGRGIHENDLDLIFEDFRQADTDSTGTTNGTGLGLAITRELVQAMGGWIHLNSQIGRGSTFEVILPLKVANVTAGSNEDRDSEEAILETGPLLRPSVD